MQSPLQNSTCDDALLLYALTLWEQKNSNNGAHLVSLSALVTGSEFKAEDLENLIADLTQGGIIETTAPQGVYLWKADFEDKVEIVYTPSLPSPSPFFPRHSQLQRQDVIADFQRIHQNYQEANAQRISIHKGLVTFFEGNCQRPHLGYEWLKHKSLATQIVLEVLARSQSVADVQVQQAWRMLIDYGIQSTAINPATLEEWITFFQDCIDKDSGGGMGFNDFDIDVINQQLEVSYYGSPSIYCAPQSFVDELRILLRRYQGSLT